DTAAWGRQLEEHGVVVLAGALTREEVDACVGLLWDWLEGLGTGIDRHDATTWTTTDGRWPVDNSSTGVVCTGGAGQSLAAWTVRSAAAVRGAFAAVWGTGELITSMDGLIRPLATVAAEARWRRRELAHPWRLAAHRPERQQAAWARGGAGAGDAYRGRDPASTGGFVCVPGSHARPVREALVQRHSGYFQAKKRGDYFHLPQDDPLQGRAVGVPAAPGDLVLWDSRLVHASEPAPGREGDVRDPDQGREQVPLELLRAAVPVCMLPRSCAAEDGGLPAWRRDALRQGVTTKHWPNRRRTQGAAAGPGYVAPELSDVMAGLL
ncbi:unnamed protein product, partial [Prorocentrum cordatum]